MLGSSCNVKPLCAGTSLHTRQHEHDLMVIHSKIVQKISMPCSLCSVKPLRTGTGLHMAA